MNVNRIFGTLVLTLITASSCFALAQSQDAAQATVAKQIGVIKAINGNAITLASDSGPEIAVSVEPNARLLRIAPGEKDLKNATPVQLSELQVNDTIRVRGHASADGKSIAALEIIVITRSTVAAVTEQMRQDWQKRGLGGLVCSVDSDAGTVTISSSCRSGKNIIVHTTKSTIVRRYAPDSIKFEDAKPSTIQEIHAGDQLRARGTRNPDGTEVAADEIVSGTFPSIAGTIKSVDANAGSLSVQDLLTKKTVQVKIAADSEIHKIPAEMAQRFAMRIKSMLPPGTPGASASSAPDSGNHPRTDSSGPPAGGMGGGMRSGGAPDFQQIVSHLPASTLSDLKLQKGDAVVILATEGTPSSASTAVTLLSGVEP